MGLYLRPGTVHEALEALAARPMTILAGATDFYPTRGDTPPDADILDITALPCAITRDDHHWHIPATTTWSRLIATPLPPLFDPIKSAARQIGGIQIQNAGTIAGNLVNASPAADGIPCLLALDAEVELASLRTTRRLPVAAFVTGPRQTALAPGELVTAIRIPARDTARGSFVKLGARRYLVISIAMAALIAELTDGIITHARLAIGACGPLAIRLPEVEAALIGHPPNPSRLTPGLFAALRPIDDVRATAAYRCQAAIELTRRAVAALSETLA